MIHAFTTGYVKLTQKWHHGEGKGVMRLVNTLFDKQFTEWLPIWCFVIEHKTGLVVIDTGIRTNANDPIYFPPFMLLVQQAAKFKIEAHQELTAQMTANGLNPADVTTVIFTHLHQDHDGSIGQFPNAEYIVSRQEWEAARGLKGRLGGYVNQRWGSDFAPTLVDFTDDGFGHFDGHNDLLSDIRLVPTYGHSAGHMSVIYTGFETSIIFAGDATYSAELLEKKILDGVTSDLDRAYLTQQQLHDYVSETGAILLPSHDPESATRLSAYLDRRASFSSQ